MKIPAKFVASVFLLCVIRDAVSSNPDSEVVQDPEEENKVPVRKSEQIRSLDDRPTMAVISNRNTAGLIVLQPFYTVTGTVYRQIASTSRDTIRIMDRGGYIDIVRGDGSDQTRRARPSYRPAFSWKPTRAGVQTKTNPPNGNDRLRYDSTLRPPRGNAASPRPTNPPKAPPPAGTSTKKISPDSNLFAGLVNNFAFKLVENLNLKSNFVISPLSIYIALSMCYLGSGGKTKEQLEQVLGMNDYAVHGENLHQGISDLMSAISPDASEYQLLLSNGLFLGANFTLEEPYKKEVREFYAAELKNLDFSNLAGSFRTINEWVAKATRNMITNFLEEPLPAQTTLALLNAIYFKGMWKTQFPSEWTYKRPFLSSNGREKQATFMNLYQEAFPVLQSDEHRHAFIKLPYLGDQVSMIIALPYSAQGSPMPALTDQALCHIRDAMVSIKLNTLAIPKFRLEYLKSLKDPLVQMGIVDIFGRSVNLTKMRRQNDLLVSDVLHKAVVDVNEEGATASAASGVQFVPLSSYTDDFVANHPFAFYIVHEASGLVLFYGKIFELGEKPEDPSDDEEESSVQEQVVPSDQDRSSQVPTDNRREDDQDRSSQVPTDNRREDAQAGPGDQEKVPTDSSGEGTRANQEGNSQAPTATKDQGTRAGPGEQEKSSEVSTNNRRESSRVGSGNQGEWFPPPARNRGESSRVSFDEKKEDSSVPTSAIWDRPRVQPNGKWGDSPQRFG